MLLFLKFLLSLNLKLDFECAPVAQLVEQWPLKLLVEGSIPHGFTRLEDQLSLIETLGKCRGFSVSSLIIVIHSLSKRGHKSGGHTPMGVWVFKKFCS